MLEIVFNESAAGSLKCGIGRGIECGGVTAIAILHEDGRPATEEEQEAARKELAEREARDRRKRAQAIPLDGSPADIFAFSAAFSVGQLADNRPDCLGEKRLAALRLLTGCYPADAADAALEMLTCARKNLETFLHRVRQGEGIRVWCSQSPDEQCGLYWLAAQLAAAKLTPEITLVTLPAFEERWDGVVVRRTSFGEVAPEEWGRLAENGVPLPKNYLLGLSSHWAQLQAENAPLRTMVNGQLVSMPEDCYDSFLLRELDALPDAFREAKLIGLTMGKYQLGVSDGWYAYRIEQFIQGGRLLPLTKPEESSSAYHRILRKI